MDDDDFELPTTLPDMIICYGLMAIVFVFIFGLAGLADWLL